MTTKVTFQLPAEIANNASGGYLLGDFNNWNHDQAIQLLKKDDGSMYAEVALAVGQTYQYRYLLNDGRWVNDNQHTTWTEVYGDYVENCVVEVPVQPIEAVSVEAIVVEATVVEAIAPAAKVVVRKAPAPKKEKLVKPVADDLLKIEGIGKKIAVLLKKEGIVTYKDLSKSTIKNLQAILTAAGNQYSMHNPASWPKQAKLAAAAKWDELSKLQQELVAGQ